ncbi:class V lanthionine synthetase subunit LxmK [Nocardioides sp. C4-1]|uniref:class V lanthionine synthetase subunit LxmK n=1 Tax=Nocardioides sp. C4-1 TaxID=3151851 RepID=UPI003265FE6D
MTTTNHAHPTPAWVLDVLAEAGLPSAPTAVPLPGRNETWRTERPTQSVVVKQLVGPNRRQRFARAAAHTGHRGPLTPTLLHADADRLVLVHSTLADAVTGSELLVEQTFTTELCRELGAGVADLHLGPLDDVRDVPPPVPSVPSEQAVSALPIELVSQFSAGEIQAWRILQSDPQLPGYLRDLREATAAAPRTPVHGDLRIDQVLVADGRPYVVDWEEHGAGDPAYDTGSWIGEWVYRAVLDIPTSRGDGLGTAQPDGVLHHQDLTTAEVVQRGVAKLDALTPHIVAFWDAYRAVRPVDAAEIARVTAFAGWHLLDRLLAHAHAASSLPGLHRAAAGIGKRILSNPAGAADALGLALTEAGAA